MKLRNFSMIGRITLPGENIGEFSNKSKTRYKGKTEEKNQVEIIYTLWPCIYL